MTHSTTYITFCSLFQKSLFCTERRFFLQIVASLTRKLPVYECYKPISDNQKAKNTPCKNAPLENNFNCTKWSIYYRREPLIFVWLTKIRNTSFLNLVEGANHMSQVSYHFGCSGLRRFHLTMCKCWIIRVKIMWRKCRRLYAWAADTLIVNWFSHRCTLTVQVYTPLYTAPVTCYPDLSAVWKPRQGRRAKVSSSVFLTRNKVEVHLRHRTSWLFKTQLPRISRMMVTSMVWRWGRES